MDYYSNGGNKPKQILLQIDSNIKFKLRTIYDLKQKHTTYGNIDPLQIIFLNDNY